jgi:hypothetical protein
MQGRGRAARRRDGKAKLQRERTAWEFGTTGVHGPGGRDAVLLCSAVRCGAPGGLVVRARPWRHRESRSLARGGGRMGRAGSSIQYYSNTWRPIRARAPRSTRAPAAYAGGKGVGRRGGSLARGGGAGWPGLKAIMQHACFRHSKVSLGLSLSVA